jgi:RNA polymerase sigma-70 factor (ECF subfamily)
MGHEETRGVERNGEALTEAFEALRDRLVGTAYCVLGHREDAREAVQEAFLKCWRKRSELRTFATLNAWIFSVVLNSAKDLRRRRIVRRSQPLPPEEVLPPDRTAASPHVRVERHEEVARVRAALRELPEREREVFLLRQNGELPYAAIAEIIGAPVGTAKTRMRSALLRLRGLLDRSGRGLSLEPGS